MKKREKFDEALLPRNLFKPDRENWVKDWINRWQTRIFPNDEIKYRKEKDGNHFIYLIRQYGDKNYELGVELPWNLLALHGDLGKVQLRADAEMRWLFRFNKNRALGLV